MFLQEIDEALMKFSKNPKLKETDSVFVVIMSHGKLGAVLGVNFRDEEPDEFPVDNIYKHLGTEKCPALLNKPKVIIIQACRGGDSHMFAVTPTNVPDCRTLNSHCNKTKMSICCRKGWFCARQR